ncbi:response regulator [Desulfitibacter alkalitolerans]|uniref:response regulator n=1 Tax=Desulfitibacter alkalitolerans TaxID=264641 RepID=UPI0004854089|nr:response regulator [Desulfitibacter alkalitolerans]
MVKVLIMEDEINIAFVLKTFLTEVGYDVIVAEDGIKGLKLLQTGLLPDIILLDLNMPGMSGRAVAERLYLDDRLAKVPVVIVSGSSPASLDFPSKDIYDAYIAKPFELSDVLEIVQKLTDFNHQKGIVHL